MKWEIPLFRAYWENDDIEAVSSVLKRGMYWADGPEIQQFERKIADFAGTKYAVAFNSGTSALHMLLQACDVKNKEVIVPSFTFVATANAVILAGGIPVFAESEPDTFGLDAEDVEKRITPKTAAIIPLHYGGFPSRDIKKLREIADKHNIKLIEDAAESLGASINGKKVGAFGHASMFSFCQNKVITTGEGGIIVTDDETIYEKVKLMRSHGRIELADDYFSSTQDNDYVQAGYNLRMPTMLAALGLSQFNKIQKTIELRRNHAQQYDAYFSRIKQITIPKKMDGHYQVYQMYTIQLPDKATRDALQTHLQEHGILSKIYFNPVHLKRLYARDYGFDKGDLPKTEALSDRVLNIPLYPGMTEEERNHLLNTVGEFFR
ncbi:DegT/DnrJ/EryC1/StrS family aminotransferase [Candidatus Woesearchaeota archaeon]|nr:DegT/DnrJ/EryC1/StrS family aminotransferase [Candidatus Woesearchaeota archaeon]